MHTPLRHEFNGANSYFDNPDISITVNKERNSLAIAGASVGRYQVMEHIVHTLDVEFPSAEELEKWHCALQNVMRPKPKVCSS